MKESGQSNEPVLLLGAHPVAEGIAACLLQAGHPVLTDLYGKHSAEAQIAIVATDEDADLKKRWIREIEANVRSVTLIGVNTETIGLDVLQENASYPGRVVGLNWAEPADTTFFLEIIANDVTNVRTVQNLEEMARSSWNKDPYVIHGNTGIRTRLLGALIREAFHLVEQGYANAEDIDRACRNDAGYYLPFAGNLRYMDLMGTYAYGMVMKDLNRELANDTALPRFFRNMMDRNASGMQAGQGFYTYAPGEAEKWQELMGKFSGEIRELIGRYNMGSSPEEAVFQLKNGLH